MKRNVTLLNAKRVIKDFDLVVGCGRDEERKPDSKITYIDKNGNLFEGGVLMMKAQEIVDKISAKGYEVVEQGDEYALLVWE